MAAHATSSGCAWVVDKPEGAVELKIAPGRQYETIGHLLPGEKVDIDTARCTSVTGEHVCDDAIAWWHVTSVPRIDDERREEGFTRGWVEDRFLKKDACEY